MSERKNSIEKALKNAERDLSINEIAEKTNLTRQTVSKYVTVLVAEGRLECTREVGNARFFQHSNGG